MVERQLTFHEMRDTVLALGASMLDYPFVMTLTTHRYYYGYYYLREGGVSQ